MKYCIWGQRKEELSRWREGAGKRMMKKNIDFLYEYLM